MLSQTRIDAINPIKSWAARGRRPVVPEKALYGFGRSAVDLYARLTLNLDVSWHAPLPAGPKILAANHPTTTDPFLIMLLTTEQVSVLVTEGVFKLPGFGRYLLAAGHVPVVYNSGGATVEAARQLLAAGRTVAIFPEGAISPLEGGCHPPHSGVARLALSTGVPVIPVGIGLQRDRIRLFEAEVDGKPEVVTWYLKGPYAMTVGEPLRFEGDLGNWAYVRSVAHGIMQRIVDLSRQSAQRLRRARAPEPRFRPGPARLAGAAADERA